MATGGCSVPQTGSDGAGLRLLAGLGLRIQPTYAALTPLRPTPPVHASLSGVSLTVTLRVAGTKASATGGFLFTHRGYSGPAVLDVSHHAVRAAAAGTPQPILAQWSAGDEAAWHAALQGGDGLVVSRLRGEAARAPGAAARRRSRARRRAAGSPRCAANTASRWSSVSAAIRCRGRATKDSARPK